TARAPAGEGPGGARLTIMVEGRMSNRTMAVSLAVLLVGGAALAGPERIEYPKDYKQTFTLFTTRDQHRGGNTVVDIYANPIALKAAKADVLPTGSIILMEAWSAKLDANQQLVVDGNGRLDKDHFRGIVLMAKRTGWGEAYPPDVRNGDWDYAAFSTDGV